MITARNLFYTADGKEIIKNISLEIARGQIFGVAGPNGSGKTTLLNILCGVLRPSRGAVKIKNKNLADYSAGEKARLSAQVPSEVFLPYDFKVSDIIVMGLNPRKKWWQDYDAADFETAQTSARRLGIEKLLDRSVGTLSTGEKQKVFLAQALAQQAEILFLDEPTSHLDLGRAAELFELLKKTGVTAVVVSHDINLLKKYSSRAALIDNGQIIFTGPPKEIFTENNIRKVYRY